MSNKHHAETTSGPSSKVLRLGSSDVELMAVDPPSVAASIGRGLPDEALVVLDNLIQGRLRKQKLDNGTKSTDMTFQDILSVVYSALFFTDNLPQSFLNSLHKVSLETAKTNATKQRASGFVDMFREAVNGNDWRLWGLVVSHGTFIDICFYYRRLISLNL